LLEEPPSEGALGADFMFFHQFFNRDLQGLLREMRRQLYGVEEPPVPMSLRNAQKVFTLIASTSEASHPDVDMLPSQVAAAVDGLPFAWAHLVSQEIGRRCLTEDLKAKGLLEAMPSRPLSPFVAIVQGPMAKIECAETATVFWRIVEQLDRLERELPASLGTLHAALAYGTPPCPPDADFRGTLHVNLPSKSWRTEGRIRVYSAKVRDIKPFYLSFLRHHGLRSLRRGAQAEFLWQLAFPPT